MLASLKFRRAAIIATLCGFLAVSCGKVDSHNPAAESNVIAEAVSPPKPCRRGTDSVDLSKLVNDPNLQNSDGAKGPEQVETVRLGAVRKLKLARPATASPAEADEIKQLIGELATIAAPDIGLSGTLTGEAFLPIEGKARVSTGFITDHGVKSSSELRKLVAFGPKALPFLLAALDDSTKTKLTIVHYGGGFGGISFENEMSGNPVNAREQRVLKKRVAKEDRLNGEKRGVVISDAGNSYTVTIGDVCFVAIGQIVGRRYNAVRYQPTNIIVLGSPPHDEELRKMIREIWTSDDAGQTLLDSLLLDYGTEEIFNGFSLHGWGVASGLQSAAAMRLLYYYPKESAGFIAERIDKLDLTATKPDNEGQNLLIKQCVANGVHARAFIEAIAWCDEPEIQAALLRAFQRAGDVNVVLAAASGAAKIDAAKVREKLGKLIQELPEEKAGPYGAAYYLLLALGKLNDDQVKPHFAEFLTPLTASRRHTMCLVLRWVRREWAREFLESFLDDRRKASNGNYWKSRREGNELLPTRVCDEAAATLAATIPGLEFKLEGTHAQLDLQIQSMRKSLKNAAGR